MSDIVKRLKEKIIVDAFAKGSISDGALCDRLIRERLDAADEIERLRAENEKLLADAERLSMMLKEQDFELERLRQSYIPFAEKHNELRDAVKQLFKDRTFATFEQNLSWLKRYIDQ